MAVKGNGGYVFISHSHKDIEKVRQIRNEMEQEGFEPLCFFLKCLSDEDEIEDLIKREIDAREWFVFIESPNSLSSEWVRKEREYISGQKGKQIIKIDLEKENPHEVAQKLIHTLRVYIAFSEKDKTFFEILENALIEKDYQVLSSSHPVTSEYTYTMCFYDNCCSIDRSGCMLAIISRDSINDCYFRNELYYAYKNNIDVIPVYIDGISPDGLTLVAEEGRVPLEKSVEYAMACSTPKDWELNRIFVAMQMTAHSDIREVLLKAKSHNEIFQYEWRYAGNEEIARLCEEAHDRLDNDPNY